MENPKEYSSSLIEEVLKSIPLKSRVKVSIQSYFISKYGGSILIPVDEDSEEFKKIEEINRKAFKEAQPIVELVLQEIIEWQEDGSPL